MNGIRDRLIENYMQIDKEKLAETLADLALAYVGCYSHSNVLQNAVKQTANVALNDVWCPNITDENLRVSEETISKFADVMEEEYNKNNNNH